jgi:hypothetical protein
MSAYTERPRDFAYLSWIRTQTCCVCEKQHHPQLGTTYAHHAGPRAFGRKAEDRTAIPLCWRHHDRNSTKSVHALGKMFWVTYGLEREALVKQLNERFDAEMEWRLAA